MKYILLFLCGGLFSCSGMVQDLKGAVPDMILYSVDYDIEAPLTEPPPKAPKSLEIQYFNADAEHRSNLIRIYQPQENQAALSYYPEYERWVGLPASMLSEKVWSHFSRHYSNAYLYPAPVHSVDYTLHGQIKHFEEVRDGKNNKAFLEVVAYFSHQESSETYGPFTYRSEEAFTPAASDKALPFVQAMKVCCTKVSENILQDFNKISSR
jgi:ABC-type uncharacterized transport system auxiliary subunit